MAGRRRRRRRPAPRGSRATSAHMPILMRDIDHAAKIAGGALDLALGLAR
ncbi:hypothetical protein [Barrientosiimonas endolithica]